MLGSAQSVFDEPDDFQTALREDRDVDLVVTTGGEFRARLSKISLCGMHLFAGEEQRPRVVFMSVSPRLIRVTLSPHPAGSMLWDGVAARPVEIVTHSGGLPFHERTDGPCHWSAIWLRTKDLVDVCRATRGATFMLPAGERRWRPSADALRSLVNLHGAAIRATTARPKLPVQTEAARGLQQQMVMALAECLTRETFNRERSSTRRRHTDIMVRFEEAVRGADFETLSVDRIALALGVSNTALQAWCRSHLGVSPGRYLYLRRMKLARQALRNADPEETTVARIARHHRFTEPGRFATAYQDLFGELPSTTMGRGGLR
jgi:AraC-like DNA-binding protein